MERGRGLLNPTDNNADSFFDTISSAVPVAVPPPVASCNPPKAAFKFTISESTEVDDPNSNDKELDRNEHNLEQPLEQPHSEKRRPSLANLFTRKPSSTSTHSLPSARTAHPTLPSQSILPRLSVSNIWDEIGNSSSLSIEYFQATLKRLAKSNSPEPQSCLDFSLLHFINIRHLEHLLYAELKWVIEAMDKALTPEEIKEKIEELPQAMENMESRYPERLKSIEILLNQYSSAVRNFEDMRKRPVKASYEYTFERTDEIMPPRRLRRFLSSSKTSSVEDLESKSSSLKPALTPEQRHVSDFNRAATVMRAVNRFGRPIGLAQRRAARQIRLSHRTIAGVEDWERDFKLQNLNLKTQREEARKRKTDAFWGTVRRFGMAIAAGMALIIPVVIMTLTEGLMASLVTTSLATIFFAIFLTWYSNANEKDIVGATAAYAAVLVVFIGTSLLTMDQHS